MEPSMHEKLTEKMFDDIRPEDGSNIEYYSNHAGYYEESLLGIGYKTPKLCASFAVKFLEEENSNMQALDICVGTGLASQELVNAGFKGKIDGIDGNEEMMKEAEKKGIFRNLSKHIVGLETPLPFKDETFDIVICTGSFCSGHVNPDCLPDFFRVVKPRGVFTFSTTKLKPSADKSRDGNLSRADSNLEDLVNKGVCEKLKESEMTAFDVSEQFKYQTGNVHKLHWYRKL